MITIDSMTPLDDIVEVLEDYIDFSDEDPTKTCKAIQLLITEEISPYHYTSVQKLIEQCVHKPTDEHMIMTAINQLMDGHGLEPLRISQDNKEIWEFLIEESDLNDNGESFLIGEYINMGDTYIPTIIKCYLCGAYHLASWGDMIEAIEGRVYELNEKKLCV